MFKEFADMETNFLRVLFGNCEKELESSKLEIKHLKERERKRANGNGDEERNDKLSVMVNSIDSLPVSVVLAFQTWFGTAMGMLLKLERCKNCGQRFTGIGTFRL